MSSSTLDARLAGSQVERERVLYGRRCSNERQGERYGMKEVSMHVALPLSMVGDRQEETGSCVLLSL